MIVSSDRLPERKSRAFHGVTGRPEWRLPARSLLIVATLLAAPTVEAQTDAVPEWQRSRPDVTVYLPQGGDSHDGDNEMLLVFPAPRSDELLATWTQSSVEGRGDNRIMIARSADGITWSEPQRIAGTPPGTRQPQASWGVPIVVETGRIYLFYIREDEPSPEDRQVAGKLGIALSDDNGRTWRVGPGLPVERNRFDAPDPTVPKKFWFWTGAIRDRHGRWLLGYTQVSSFAVKPKPAPEWPHADTRCALIRFDNLKEGPEPRNLKLAWLPTESPGLEVPNKMYPQISTCQEPATVLLPDGRLMVVMRTFTGHPYYSVSEDDGASWREPEPLCYRDGGEKVKHPISPCPLFSLADGRFLFLYHNNDGTVGKYSQWDRRWARNVANHIRNPTFLALGEFRPKAHQPIWFSPPKEILDSDGVIYGPKRTAEVGTYPSLTEWHGRRTLWYPDRKYFLLGKYLPDELLADMVVPKH